MHRESAITTLLGNDVTVVASFDEAIDLMARNIDEAKVQRLLVEAGFTEEPDRTDMDRLRAYWSAQDHARLESIVPLEFDVVLTDLMMPMSRRTLAPGVYIPGEQVPYGFIIALRAANRGVKYVAVVTDTNHHQGAMSAALDHLGSAYWDDGFEPNFTINGAAAMFVHAPTLSGGAKDWGKVLGQLTS
jgi:CheY-like chemotaxis protein